MNYGKTKSGNNTAEKNSNIRFSISEETRNIQEIVNKITKLVQRKKISLDEKIEIFEKFSKQGETLTSQTIFEGYPIGQWAVQLRNEINRGREVSPEQYEKLSELRILGRQIDSTIDEKIEALVKWNEKYPKARLVRGDIEVLREYALFLGEDYNQLISEYEKMQQYYDYVRARNSKQKLTPEQFKKCNEGNVGGVFGVPASWIQKYGMDEEKIEDIINEYGTIDNFMDEYINGNISDAEIYFLGVRSAINIDSNIRNDGYDELAKDLATYINERTETKMIIYSREAIEELLQNFPYEKQRIIIEEMYGLQTGEKKNIQEIADKIGISKKKTKEFEDKAIANLAGIIENTKIEEIFPIGLNSRLRQTIMEDFKQTIKDSRVIFNSEKQTTDVEKIKEKADRIKRIISIRDNMPRFFMKMEEIYLDAEKEEILWKKVKKIISNENISKKLSAIDKSLPDITLAELLENTFPDLIRTMVNSISDLPLDIAKKEFKLPKDSAFSEILPGILLVDNKKMKIKDMNLTFRSFKCLERAGVDTLEDLLQIDSLEKITNLNEKTKDEIIEKVQLYVSKYTRQIDLDNEEDRKKIIEAIEEKIKNCIEIQEANKDSSEKYTDMDNDITNAYLDENDKLLEKIYIDIVGKDDSDMDVQQEVECDMQGEQDNIEEQKYFEISENTAFSEILPKRVILKQGNLALEDMDFSIRAYTTLKRCGIDNLSDLLNRHSLSQIRGLGMKMNDEINEKVKQYVVEASVPEEERDNTERQETSNSEEQEIFEIFEDTAFSDILPQRVVLPQGDVPIEDIDKVFVVTSLAYYLHKANIRNLSDLLMMETDDLYNIKGIGKKKIDIIKEQVRKYVVDAVEHEDNLEVKTSGEETVLSEIDEKEDKHEQEEVIEEKQEDTTTSKQFEINRFLENSRKLAELDSKLEEAIKEKNEVEAQRIKEERDKTAKEIQDYLNK